MIRRLYIHDFLCLQNFELPISRQPSTLLIGENGSGKSTIGFALQGRQRVARGNNRVGKLVRPGDFSMARSQVPMRLEIQVELQGSACDCTLALELPEGFRELRMT